MNIPRPEEWQRDSSVTLAIRNNDTTLRRVDNLLEQYARNEGASAAARFRRQCLVCDLFFTVDFWLKTYRNNFHMASGRADTVNALYRCVVDQLCGADMFDCPVNILPTMLEAMFGRSLSDDAVRVDAEDRAAEYMSLAMATKSKLVIKSGLLYGYRWESGGEQGLQVVPTNKLVRLDTCDLANPAVHADAMPGFERYAFFVMSVDRDLFMRQHYSATLKPIPYAPGNLNPGIYHSSYLGQNHVGFAGSMLVENGVLRSLRNDSGHFKPNDSNYVALLWALQMHGISTDGVSCYEHTGRYWCRARDILNNNGDWTSLIRGALQNAADKGSVLAPQSVRDAADAAAARRAAAAAAAGAGGAAPAPAPAPAPAAAAAPGLAAAPAPVGGRRVYNQYEPVRAPGAPRYDRYEPDGAAARPRAYDRYEPDDGGPPVHDAFEAVLRQG
jgi:hypothetical protein